MREVRRKIFVAMPHFRAPCLLYTWLYAMCNDLKKVVSSCIHFVRSCFNKKVLSVLCQSQNLGGL